MRATPRVRRWCVPLALVTVDAAVLIAVSALALGLGSDAAWTGGAWLPLGPAVALFIGLYLANGLYAAPPPAPAHEIKRQVQAITVGLVVLAAVVVLGRGAAACSGRAFLAAWLLGAVSAPVARAALRSLCARRDWWGLPLIVLGAGKTGEILVRSLLANPGMGLRPVVVLDDDPRKHGSTVCGVPVDGPIERAVALARDLQARHAVVAMPGADQRRLLHLWGELGPQFPHLFVIPALVGFSSLWVEARDVGGVLGLQVRQNLLLPWPRALKRGVDLLAVLVALPLLLPLMLLIAAAIALDSPGGVLFRQRRLGRGGREFTAWKFRSMRAGAEALLDQHLAADQGMRLEWERGRKLRQDPRVTRLGRLLRRTSLDELPQLWNVLLGDMSLVGPRPVVGAEAERYGPHLDLYRQVRPGLSGLWQVSGRSQLPYDQRVALDAYYIRNWSVWLDAFIIVKTVRVVLRGEGAY